MICPKCARTLPDGSRFCSSCGAEIQPQDQTERSETVPSAQNIGADNVNVPERSVNGAVKPKKPMNTKIVIAAAAVVAVVAAIFAFKAVFSSKNTDNPVVYISDGKYELIKKLENPKPIEIGYGEKAYYYSSAEYPVKYSDDGKYIYYCTRDGKSDDSPFSLCRAEYKKLGENQSENSKHTTVIDSGSIFGFFIKDKDVFYRKDGDLYMYDGKESERIEKDCSLYMVFDGGRIIYTTGSGEDQKMFGTELKNPENKFEIASGNISIKQATEKGTVIYSITEDDTVSLYRFEFGGKNKPEKIADNVERIEVLEDNMYFVADDGSTVDLYDFVEEDGKEIDDDYARETLETLKSGEGIRNLKAIYLCRDGKVKQLKKGLFYVQFINNAAFFTTKDYPQEKVKKSRVRSIGGLESMFNLDEERDNYAINLFTAEEFEFPKEAMSTFNELHNGQIYFGEKNAYITSEDNTELLAAEIKNSTVTKFVKIEDNARFATIKDGVMYYSVYTDEDEDPEFDLYAYENNESKRIASDVLNKYETQIFDDKTVITLTWDGELTVFGKNGEGETIADDVTKYLRADDKLILYISDEDLYSYDGNRKVKIKTDVSDFFCKSSLDSFELVFPRYDGIVGG